MVKNIDDGNRRGRKEDEWWKLLFKRFNIVQEINKHGIFEIDAKTINAFCDPRHTEVKDGIRASEARLMTKWDTTSSLPNVFKEHNVTILSTGIGKYILGRFEVYNKLITTQSDLLTDVKEMYLPDWMETLNADEITTENDTLNAATASGMFDDFLDGEKIYQTASGRTSSKVLDFKINDMNTNRQHEINVRSAQAEIDASFESRNSFYIIEAKNYIVEDFCNRQLFYPYQLWQKKTKKEVFPIFVQYEKGIFNLSMFQVDDLQDYNAMRLIKRQNYKLN